MSFALDAVSSALGALQSLTAKKTTATPTTGPTQNATAAFDLAGGTANSASSAPGSGGSSANGRLSPDTMHALLAAQSQSSNTSATSNATSRSDALKDLFKLLDGDGDGKISKAEFEDKLGAGGTNVANADKVFDKLDKDDDGSVSLDELMSALKGKGHHHHKAAGSDGTQNAATSADGATDPLLQALQGASSTSTVNSDGTTTTSLTYADGSKVSMTSAPGGTSSSGAATSSYNFIEQLIQRQSQAISGSAASSLSVSA